MQEQTFKAGELIFREGEDSDLAYLIVSGRVDIFKRMDNGATVLLATLGDGEIFGEMSIISEQPRTASAAASTLVTVKKSRVRHSPISLPDSPKKYGWCSAA